jgi:hypothetical protein
MGLGDNLLLTPILKALPNKLTVQLPVEQSRFKILFHGLADVELCQPHELIPVNDVGDGPYARRKLRALFGSDAETMDIRPVVLYADPDSNNFAADYLKDKPNPIIICPFVSKKWSNVRDLPFDTIQEILWCAKLKNQTPIIVQSDSDAKWDCATLNNLELPKLICLLRQVGRYVGSNTGVQHLAIAVGCLTDVYEPEDGPLFQSSEWRYDSPSIKYYTWLRS